MRFDLVKISLEHLDVDLSRFGKKRAPEEGYRDS